MQPQVNFRRFSPAHTEMTSATLSRPLSMMAD